jgi:hypothetical protein
MSTMNARLRTTSANRPSYRVAVIAVAVGLVVATQPGIASVKVRIDRDKEFDFSRIRTWAWNAKESGQVVMARTADDDPETVKKRAEPIITAEVNAIMPSRGPQLAAPGATPDATLMYYLLLTVGTSAQTMGQFLPAVTEWGIPPFSPQTQSLEMMERGSLVLDLTVNRDVVWRGVAEAKVDWELTEAKREKLLRDAVRELLKKYPPKK